MTVREVMEALAECDPDWIVVMSKDEEGNGFSPLADVAGENNVYIPDSTWSGTVRVHHLTDELREQGFTEEDLYDYREFDDEPARTDGQRAVVLWPMN